MEVPAATLAAGTSINSSIKYVIYANKRIRGCGRFLGD